MFYRIQLYCLIPKKVKKQPSFPLLYFHPQNLSTEDLKANYKSKVKAI